MDAALLDKACYADPDCRHVWELRVQVIHASSLSMLSSEVSWNFLIKDFHLKVLLL